MKRRFIFIWIIFYFLFPTLFSQNTVGVLSLSAEKSIGGYNLIYPENQSTIYLINECGEIVNSWEDHPDNLPGKTAYLFENGNLLRAKIDVEKMTQPSFGAGGAGGVVEILNWENESLWHYVLADEKNRQHHDVHIMENGNVLLIAWELKSFDEMLENGFDSSSLVQVEYWPEFIRELNPVTNDTVWEWHVWDHLIQDYDSTKLNYGVVSDHPELIDINYNEYSSGRADWMHANAIDYNQEKDQILLSVRNFNEVWIIDHSTTTEEAAGHIGGNSGKGGDILFRWGNPKAFKKGETSDRKLFYQHDAQWIDDFVDSEYEFYGDVVLYNNFIDGEKSLGQIISPVWDSVIGSYSQEDGLYLPTGFSKTISHPDTSKNFSGIASSIQIMADGHIVMCAAAQGFLFELTPSNQVAWEYRTPLKLGFQVEQGVELELGQNVTFQLERYPESYPAFIGKDLSSKGFIELEPNTSFCAFTNVEEIVGKKYLKIYPNPTADFLIIENNQKQLKEICIINHFGKEMACFTLSSTSVLLPTSNWPTGIYFVRQKNNNKVQKIIVAR